MEPLDLAALTRVHQVNHLKVTMFIYQTKCYLAQTKLVQLAEATQHLQRVLLPSEWNRLHQ